MPHRGEVPLRYHGKPVGDGHCVALVREVTGLPPTAHWRRGAKVRGHAPPLPAGTAIACFDQAGRYTSRTDGTAHAAILIAEQSDGLLVWDQWLSHPTSQRVIRFRGGASGNVINDGDAFYAIELVDT
jgi:hypothetical protein